MNPEAVSRAKPRQRAMTAGSSIPPAGELCPSSGPSGARTHLILTPTERSFGAEILPLVGLPGTPEALAAARAGDLKRLDEHEIAWLNTWGPRPTVEQLTGVAVVGLVAVAREIWRGAGPRGEALIVWGIVEPCPRCWRRLALRPRCWKCSGRGHMNDELEVVYTDLDGNVLEIGG